MAEDPYERVVDHVIYPPAALEHAGSAFSAWLSTTVEPIGPGRVRVRLAPTSGSDGWQASLEFWNYLLGLSAQARR